MKIMPLGGLDQIGMNMTLVECNDEIVIIDCGQAFPGEDLPGIDSIIPNFDYLRQNYDKIRGVVLTHGHEDHIGALPYFLREFKVPVYGTRLTLGLVRNKLEEFGIRTASIVNMQEVTEHLYGREINGQVVIDDERLKAIRAYYEQYGAQDD